MWSRQDNRGAEVLERHHLGGKRSSACCLPRSFGGFIFNIHSRLKRRVYEGFLIAVSY